MQITHETHWDPAFFPGSGVIAAICFILSGLLTGALAPAHAQIGTSAADALTSQERPTRIAFRPTYQWYEDGDQVITEWSAPVVAVVPFQDRWQLSVRGGGAWAGGDDLETLSGLTDLRVALSYAQPVSDGSLIVTANVSAPTGKQELTREEFNTARLLSRNLYRFRVPSFGQGLGAGTGLTWAVPVTDAVVVGIGGMFRYHGSYTPTAASQTEYDPGEEGRITGGVDIRLGDGSAVSADASFYVYGTDTAGNVDRFSAGNQVSARVQYLRQWGQNALRITGHYRNQEKSTIPLRQGDDRALQVLPTRALVRGQYTVGFSGAVDLEVTAAGRWYDETSVYDDQTIGTVGLAPHVSLGDVIRVSPRAAYTTGSITGLEGGLGLTAEF